MAFNINAHVILQGPKNIQKVTNTIKQQLSGISVPVNLQVARGANTQLGKINNQLNALSKTARTTQTSLSKLNAISASVGTGLGKSAGASSKLNSNLGGVAVNANKAAGAMATLGKETALTFKRFAAAGIVTATVFRLGAAISEATGNALEFERELVKLQQVTGQNAKQLDGLKNAVRDVSKGLGISANELVGIARLFAQTGQNLREVEASMKAIARSTLAPTFGDMAQTAEGLIAALAQFKIAASNSEAVLGSLNRVSKKFAVESQDLIAAIRRAGGVFALSAGQFKEPIEALNEFSAIFTAVRSTTRESAETIATGLRTIFTRIQRRGTIDMLKGLGINLLDAQGKFKGLFESFRILSKELDTIIQKGDAVTLSAIAEELGGTRQIGKLLPAIREFRRAESALVEAQKGAVEGLGSDVQKGLTPLIKQFEQLGARFEDFIRTIADSRTFKQLSQFALDTANAFLTLGEALAPLLPLFTQLAAAKLARGAFAFGQGFLGSTKGLGAGGLGSRVGGLVAGSPQGSSPAVTQQTQGNTSALLKNTTALTNLTKGLGGLKGITTALSGLDSSIDLLNSRMSDLSRNVNNLATRSFGGGFGTSGGGSRRRRGFSSGGRVPFASGGRVPFAKPLPRVPRKAPTSPRGTQTFGSSQFGTSSTGYTLGASDTVRKETGLNLTGQETVTIKPGVSPKRRRATTFGVVSLRPKDVEDALYADITWSQAGLQGSGKGLRKSLGSRKTKRSGRSEVNKDQMTLQVLGDSLDANIENNFEDQIETAMRTSVTDVSKAIRKKIGIVDKKGFSATDVKQAGVNFENISGNLFEHMLNTVGHPYSPDKVNANDAFDFPAGIGANLGSVFPTFPSLKSIPTDAKRTLNKDAMRSLIKKSLNTLKKGMAGGARFSSKGSRGKFAMQAAQGLQRTMARDPQYWTDDGLLKSILMPGELVASGVPASQANRIASGSLDAVMGLNPSNVAVVPGTGDRDTFPMDLAPGTVVVPKGLSQEAMADGFDPRVPLASGGRVPFKKAGRVPFAGPKTTSRSGSTNIPNVDQAGQGLAVLADAAVSASFALSFLDFSSVESSLLSLTQLSFVIPGVVASFKALPQIISALQVAKLPEFDLFTSSGGLGAYIKPIAKNVALTLGTAIIAGFSFELIGKAFTKAIAGDTAKLTSDIEGVEKSGEGVDEFGRNVGLTSAALAGLTTAFILGKLGFQDITRAAIGFGTAAAFAARAFNDYNLSVAKAVEYDAFAEFNKKMDKATEVLELFNNSGSVTAKGIRNVNKAVQPALELDQALGGAAYDRAFTEASATTGIGAAAGAYGGAKIGAAIGTAIAPGIGTAVGAVLGAVVGGIAGNFAEGSLFQGGAGDRAEAALQSADRLLAAVSDKMIEKVNQAFEKIVESFVTSIPDGSYLFQALTAIDAPLNGIGSSVTAVGANFQLLQNVLTATGEQGKAFANFLDTKLRAGLIESVKASDENVKRLFAAASAQGIDFSNVAELNDNLGMLAFQAGLTGSEAATAASALQAFTVQQQRLIISTINQRTAQEQLDRMMNQVTKSIQLFVAGAELMSKMMETAVTRFGLFSSEVNDFVSYMTGGGGRIMQPGRSTVNPFTDIESSSEEAINAGIERIAAVTGANTEGLKDTIKLRKIIPDIPKALSERAGGRTIQTGTQLANILRDVVKDLGVDISKLPPSIVEGLEKGLDAQIKRQGAGVTLDDILAEGSGFQEIIDQFGEGADKIREALEKSYKAQIEAQKQLIDVVNQYIGVEKFRIEQSVKANAIVENTSKALDRFRSGSNAFEKANARLINRLNAIDRGRGNITLNPADQAAAVQARRNESKRLRDALALVGGPAIGADMTADEIRKSLESTGTIFSGAALSLVDALADNEKALMSETKKLDQLINETEILEATTQTLSDVQKAQMDAEAQARFFINQLARVEGETDPIKRGQMLAELMMPFTAFDKALTGGTLSMREFASLVGNFDARLAPMLRSLGVSEEEIAGAKRNFFARFSQVFPDIFTSAVEQSFVRVTGNLEGVLKNIATSMETAGKRFEDIEAPDFPALMKPMLEQFGLGMNASVGDIMDAVDVFAEAKANALLEDTENIAGTIEDAIKEQLKFLGSGASEMFDGLDDASAIAEAAIAEFGFTLSDLTTDVNTELGFLVSKFREAGQKFNDFSIKASEEASKEVAASNRLVGVSRTKKEVEFFRNEDELLKELQGALDSGAPGIKDAIVALAKELNVPTGMEIDGGFWKQFSAQEILNDITGEGDKAQGYFNVREDGILAAARRAGVGRIRQTTTSEIRETDPTTELFETTDKGEIKSTGLFTEVLGGFGSGLRDAFAKKSLDELKEIFTREFDTGAAEQYGAVPRGFDRTEIANFNESQLIDRLVQIATERAKKVAGQGGGTAEERSEAAVNYLVDQLIKLGGSPDTLEKLLKERGTEVADRAAFQTASNTAQMVGILQDIERNTEAPTIGQQANGGYIGGRSHAQGGTLIEAEAGEFMFKKTSAASIGASALNFMNNTGKIPMARNGGSVSIGSMGDLANVAGTMDFAGLTELLNAMNEFSGGNGMDAIANSNAMIGQGGIIQNMMTRMQQGSMGGGPQGPQSVRQQLDAVFQKRLGNLTGGIGTLKGQVLNNALKEFSGLVIKEGSVEGAEKRTGGKRSIDKISRILRDFGMTSNKIESSIDIFKSLLGDEKDNLSQEKQLLAQMGIVQKQGSPEASALAKQLKDQFKKLQEGQSKLIDSSEKIQENTDPTNASCVCIDKLIAFLAGFPVDIAKAVISPSQVVGGGAGAGGAGGGTKPLDPDGVMEIVPGGGPRHPGPGQPPYIPGGAQGTGTLGAIGDAIGGAISGTVGNIVDGVMGSASMISDIKSGLEGALESITSGIGDFFSGGGAGGFQNVDEGGTPRKRLLIPTPTGGIDPAAPVKPSPYGGRGGPFAAFANLAEYFKGSIEQFADGITDGAELAAYSMKFYADAIAKGGTMTEQEFEKYVESLLPKEVLDQKRVNEAREKATRGADYEVTDFDKKVRNLTPEQAALLSEQEKKTGSGQGQFTEKATKDKLAKLESQAAKFRRGGKFGRPSETSTTYYSGFKNRVDPEEQAFRDKFDANMERDYNRRKNAAKFGSAMEIVPGGGPRSMGPGGVGATAQRFKNQAAAARERFKNRNRAADIDKAASSPPAAKAGPLEEIEMNKVDPQEKMTVQLINGLCSCFAAIFKPIIIGLKDVEDAVVEKPLPEIPSAEPPKIPVDPVPTPDPNDPNRGIDRAPPEQIILPPTDFPTLPGPSEIEKAKPKPSDPTPKTIAPIPKGPSYRGLDPRDVDPKSDLLPDGRGAAPKRKSRLGQGLKPKFEPEGVQNIRNRSALPLDTLNALGLVGMGGPRKTIPKEADYLYSEQGKIERARDADPALEGPGLPVSPIKFDPKAAGIGAGGLQSITQGSIRKILGLDKMAAGGSEGLLKHREIMGLDKTKVEDLIPPGGKFDRIEELPKGKTDPYPGLEPFPPLEKGPGSTVEISTLPDTIEKGNAEVVQAIAGICGCFAISVGDLAIGDEVADQANNIQDSILGSIGNALLNAAKTVGSDLIEKGKTFVDFITDKDAIKSTIEENRAGLSAVGNVDAAKTGIDNIFGFIDGIKAVVNNIQKGQPYEGLGGRPYVATPMRDQEGNMTGFSPVPQRSAAGPGRGPLYLGVGRAGQERYDTMTSNRDKFAAQLEDPKFAEQAAKNPKGYAARILAQKEALDANIQELEEQYGFGPGGQDAANPAEKAGQEKAKQEAGQMPAKQQGNLAAGIKAAESMGFIWDPSDKDATIGDLISFLQSTCLSVQFCDKAAGSTTPEAPRTSYDEGVIEGPEGQGPMIPSEGTDGTVYTPLPPAYGSVPYPPNFSSDDNVDPTRAGDPSAGKGAMNPLEAPGAWNPTGRKNAPFDAAAMLGLAEGTSIDQALSRVDAANAGGKAPGDEASGNVENIISKLEGIGPLISDETVTRLESFTNNFGTFTDSVVSRMENVTSQIQNLLGQTLQVQLTTNRIDVVINAGNVLNKVQAVVQEEILNSVGQEIQTMKEQIKNLATQNNPLGSPDSSSNFGNSNNLG